MQSADIEALFHGDVSVKIATAEMYESTPPPIEMAAVAGSAPGRQREFAAGRTCARLALQVLGVSAAVITRGLSRGPVWPTGFVGSITHCEGFCCAVVASTEHFLALGIDAEDAAPLEPAVTRYVCGANELVHFQRLPGFGAHVWAKVAFSAKEAFFKAYQPLVGEAPDFCDIAVEFTSDNQVEGGAFRIVRAASGDVSAERLEQFEGQWRVREGRVYTGVSVLAR
jgi:4'-phosphopantetheinyl transferase EntD